MLKHLRAQLIGLLAALLFLLPGVGNSIFTVLTIGEAQAQVQRSNSATAKTLVEISIDYSWVGWGSKRLSYLIRRKTTGWVANEQTAVKQKTIEAVSSSLTGLQPSDRIRTCWSHTDDSPRFRILLRKANSVIELTSNSNCTAYAPWNVIESGQLKVQYNGAIGRAINKLLRDLDPDNWTKLRRRRPRVNEMVNLTAGDKPPAGITGAEPIELKFKSSLIDSALYKSVFGAASPTITGLYCYLRKNPECEQITGQVSVPWGSRVAFEFKAAFDKNQVTEIEVPSELDKDLANLERSKLLEALDLPPSGPRTSISFTRQNNCMSKRAYLKYVEKFADKLPAVGQVSNCDYYFISAAGKSREKYPPSIFYYPSLGVAWLRNGETSATQAFYERLGISKALLEKIKIRTAGWIFSDLKGKVTELE